jgi:hypothetical protein
LRNGEASGVSGGSIDRVGTSVGGIPTELPANM